MQFKNEYKAFVHRFPNKSGLYLGAFIIFHPIYSIFHPSL